MAARARHQGAASSTVFVTVGTTSFDDLIVAVTSDTALTNLAAIGVDTLVVQYGRGSWPAAAAPANRKSHGVMVKAYALKPSTADDIAAARFVVCHGGAGSIFDTLRAGRPAVVVPNATLMGNHQLELAHALEEANHVRLFTVESLPKGLLSLHLDKLTPVPPSNASGFRARVDATMGVATGGVVTGKKRA